MLWYILFRLLLRIKMGKKKRDEYLKNTGISVIDFLPERPYAIQGVKAIPRKGFTCSLFHENKMLNPT
jgi:hypothetical protein